MRRSLVCAALAVAAVRVSAAQQLGSLKSAVDARVGSQGLLVWAGDRPLARGDFRGIVPADTSALGAVSAVGLLHAIICDAKHFEFAVVPFFIPDSSWTRPEVLRNDARGAYELAHEQGHFDLTEISARQLRAELAHFNVACDSATDVFTTIADAAVARHAALQVQYDNETVHALKVPEQERWLAMIKALLDTVPAGTAVTNRKYWKP